MRIWSNTTTLSGYVDDLQFTEDKSIAQMALIGGKPINLAEFPKLKGLFKTGVGTDNVPFEDAKSRGVEVRLPSDQTSSWIFEETANFACYLVLRMLYDHAGELATWTKFPRRALRQQTVLVIGTGNIGRRVVAKLSGLCNVVTYDAAHDDEAILDNHLAVADCVTLHIPLVAATRGFFDNAKLRLMKQGAALVNTARGPIVDEAALETAVGERRIRAAFDVFWKEPYQGPLTAFSTDQFLMTPHIASTCEEFLQGCADDFREFCNEFK